MASTPFISAVTSRVLLAKVVYAVRGGLRRYIILRGPCVPLLAKRLNQRRLFPRQIFQFRSVPLHVIEAPWFASKRRRLIAMFSHRPMPFMLEEESPVR